jgi:4-amino-4-deoxy-L-arabinose transferase-like glycosyltransferase
MPVLVRSGAPGAFLDFPAMSVPRSRLILGGVVVLAALLRVPTLGEQSFWFDETITAQLVDQDLGGVLAQVEGSESTPPLYYLLAWAWSGVLGTGEAALRSLSALLGIATVVMAWLLGRRLAGDRAAALAALLTATCPLLVWFSQEARAYALLAFLGALSALLALRARQEPAARRLAAWAVGAVLALATHYFAAFLIAAEAVWLLVVLRGRRPVLAAVGGVTVAALALAPLALAQRERDLANFIGDQALITRVAQVPKQFLVGYDAPVEAVATVLALMFTLAGAALLLARGDERQRRGALLAGGAGAVAVLVPLALAVVGVDHFLARNTLVALPVLLVALGVAFAAARAPRAGLALGGGLAALWIAIVIGVAVDPRYQREDWRGAAAALGAPADRAVVVTPLSGVVPLEYYRPALERMPAAGTTVREVVLLGLPDVESDTPPDAATIASPGPAFIEVGRTQTDSFTLVRFRAPSPQPVAPAALAGLDAPPGQAGVLTGAG